jgi:DNA polymerase III delta subunit
MAELVYNSVSRKPGLFPQNPLPLVYLLVGSDDGLKHEALSRINESALDPAFADFDRETIDLSLGSASEDSADPVSRIAEAVGTVPFSSPRRVVTVVSVQKLTKERQDLLAAFLPKLPALTLLLLIADATETEGGRPKGKQVELSLRKAVAKAGTVLVCDAPEAADLRARAAQILAASGKTFEPAVIDLLLAASSQPGQPGADLNSLNHESAKLLAYVANSDRITRDDAAAVLPVGIDENIFRLLDSIGGRNVPRSMHELDALIAVEGKADATAARLIVMLQRHFRLLILAKFLADRHLLGKNPLPQEVKDQLSSEMASFAASQAYRLSAYAKQASNFRWEELHAAVGRILAADLSMKGITPGVHTMRLMPDFGDDAQSTLRLLVFDLCRSGK